MNSIHTSSAEDDEPPQLITITLNPSLDRTLVTHYLATGYKNSTTEPTQLAPAGRGVNISRAAYQLGARTQAIVLLGGDTTGRAYHDLLSREEFGVRLIHTFGRTRSRTIIRDSADGSQTEIVEEREPVDEGIIDRVMAVLHDVIAPDDTVVLAGSLPPGAPLDTYGRLVAYANQAGARTAVITATDAMRATVPEKPDLLAVTRQQLESYFNYPVRLPEDIIGTGEKLRAEGVDQVLIDVREDQVVLFLSGEGRWSAQLPEDDEGTSTGVWDAMMAGVLIGVSRESEPARELQLGGAAAAYAASQVGVKFGDPWDIRRYLDSVKVQPVTVDSPHWMES